MTLGERKEEEDAMEVIAVVMFAAVALGMVVNQFDSRTW
jgi:hypothetical protein